MSYTTTTKLSLEKAVPGTNQPFETSSINNNWDKVDAEAVAIAARFTTDEATIASHTTTLGNLNTSVTANTSAIAGHETRISALEGASSANMITNVTGTTYGLLASDKNKTVVFNTTTSTSVTVGAVLQPGERIDLLREGTGDVIFTASGVTLIAKGSATKISAQYGGATILCIAAGQYRLIGDIA